MTKSFKTDYSNIDIYDLLEQRRQVAVIWGIEDVQQERPDLNDNQAWEVLQFCRDKHDCELGFTWNLIQTGAEILFGSAPDSNDDEGDDNE